VTLLKKLEKKISDKYNFKGTCSIKKKKIKEIRNIDKIPCLNTKGRIIMIRKKGNVIV
jgi:hypothetical protein